MLLNRVNGNYLLIFIIVVVGAALRIFYAADMPLGGDEVGVGVLQAAGQAMEPLSRFKDKIVPIAEIRKFISYSPMFSTKDVIDSLRRHGMHPPLYYLGLHYVLKYIGNEIFTLRMVSIVISLLCIVFMYRLEGVFMMRKQDCYALCSLQ